MINFYHRFLPNAAHVLSPLYRSLRNAKSTTALHWSPEMTSAFKDGKSLLCQAALLVHPIVDAPIALTVDASDLAVGAVLEQEVGGVRNL